MQFRVLGHIEVADARGIRPLGGPKQRAVLAYLLLRAGDQVSTDRLIDAVWNGAPPGAARTSVHSYVSNLRRTLGVACIERQSNGYVFRVERDEVDANGFTSLLTRADQISPGRPTARGELLEQALALWRGPALADLASEPAFQPDATRLNELRATAREDLIAARLATGAYGAAVASVEPLLAADPLRERLWSQLIAALYLDGRQGDALAAYGRARAVLSEQLGIEPSPGLQQIHAMVLAQDVSLHPLYPSLRGYRLLERIDGTGDVARYRAEQPSTRRVVLIDVIGPPLANDPVFVRRFETDAQAVSALRHPNIVGLIDWWREPDAAYQVTGLVPGRALAARLADDALDAATAARIVDQLGQAVGAAHRRGVGHGAISTDTVLIDEDGNARLAGFVVGRVTRGDAATFAADQRAVSMIAAALRHDDRATGTAAGAGTRGPNPYKGLRMFREADADDFFGRTAAVGRLVECLGAGRFVALVGPSGAGKSSLLRAGLVPEVRTGALPGSERWLVVVVVPGPSPFEGLLAALLSIAREPQDDLAVRLASGAAAFADAIADLVPHDTELLLAIDQFEELFTLVDDEDDRAAFIAGLTAAVTRPGGRVRLVVTLRADHFDRPLRYDALANLLMSHTEIVAHLAPAEVTRAVIGPAERAGVTVEPGLLAQIVRDVSGQPGALPLLQYVLTEIYEHGGATLTLDDYRRVGGLAGALAGRADQTLAQLPSAAAESAHQLVLRLVTLSELGGATRRRVRRGELLELTPDAHATTMAIDALGAARLLTFDRDPVTREPVVEIAHDALLTEWGRLRGWIDGARAELATERRLAAAASEWLTAGRDASFLATGHRLDQFADLMTTSAITLTSVERDYVAASMAQRRRRDEAEAQRRADRERLRRRAVRRLQAIVAVLSVAALVAATLTGFALQQRARAQRAARIAAARELAAAAVANLDADPQRSLLLAIEAVDRTRAIDGEVLPMAEDALHRAVQASRVVATLDGAQAPIAWSGSGELIATGSTRATGSIDVRDAGDLGVVASIVAHDGDVTGVAFSSDGSLLATTGDDGALRLWNPATGRQVGEIDRGDGRVQAPSFSADGALVTATLPDADAVLVVDARTGTLVDEIATVERPVVATPSSRGDVAYVVGGPDPAVRTLALSDGRVRYRVDTEVARRQGVAFSPDGRWLATTHGIIDADTGVEKFLYDADPGVVPTWSRDGGQVVTGGVRGTIQAWRLSPDGTLVERVTLVAPTAAALVEAAVSPDASQLLTVDDTGNVDVWNIGDSGGAEVANLSADHAEWPGIAWSPDASRLAVSSGDGDVAIWRTDTWSIVATIAHGHRAVVSSIAWNPDGTLLATVGRRHAKVWNARDGRLQFAVPYAAVFADVTWTPDGEHLAVTGNRSADIVDRTGARVASIPSVPGEVIGAGFNDDGTLLGVAVVREGVVGAHARDNDAIADLDVWDWRRGELVASIDMANGSVAFDPTGDRVVMAHQRGEALVVPVDRRGASMPLVGHVAKLTDVTFSADGGMVATASEDETVRLWDPDSGEQTLVLRGHDDGVDQVRFSPDGRWLASSSASDGVRVWALRIDDLLAIARSKVARGFTAQECEQYLHLPRRPGCGVEGG